MTGCSISVIMPVFNAELYLKYAIDSVLHQSLQDFEFIIINDGSTDASEQIILSYENPRIRYINNIENKGLVYSLNKGIEESIGKYIVRMDADDISLPERFAIQLKFLDDNQQYGLCCSDISTIDANNEIITSEYYGELSAPLEWQMLWENPVAHPTVMMRREFIDTFNFRYDESDFPAEDYGLWCRFILKSPIKRLKETLLYYRISANSIFHSSKARALEKASLVTTQYAHD
ncbi:MAG: glycosyltransferase family 2 protein, partial [Daejeonella sp.]|uniref:glycosyltransferase family 2 protein n=1 Tax=Daejeonella sp. TaxID=2805397 RepID=UPI003C717459